MATEQELKAQLLQARKQILLAQGALLRAELGGAQSAVRAGLRPESLAHNALSNIAATAFAAFKQRASGGGLQAMLPLLISGVSALSRKGLVKPVVRGVLIAGAVGMMYSMAAKRKRARTAEGQQ